MVGSIRPVVYRDSQSLRWFAAAALHLLGSVTAATITGAVLGWIGGWLGTRWGLSAPLFLVVLSIVSVAYALDEMGVLRLPSLNRSKQVPASWRAAFHPYVTALLYGIGLGNGLLTRVVTGAVYVVVIGVIIRGNPFYGAAVCALFGLGRGGSVGVLGWGMRNLRTSDEFFPRLQGLIARSYWLHCVMGVALGLAGGYGLAAFGRILF